MAIHHPDRFSSVVSLSGYFHAVTDSSTGDLYKGNQAAKRSNSPAQTVGLPGRALSLRFYLAASGGDREGLAGIKEFAPKIKPPDHLTKVLGGNTGHNFSTWRRALPDVFAWLGKTFSQGPASQASGPLTQPPSPPATKAPGTPAKNGKKPRHTTAPRPTASTP
jgi:enterochelin esterase-like enzyme